MSEYQWKEKILNTTNPITQRQWIFQKYMDAFRAFGRDQKKILEVGCGRGTVGLYFAQDGKEVTFIDIEQQAVDLVQQNLLKLNVPGRVRKADVLNLPYGKNSFGMVCSVGLIEHLKEGGYEKCLEECYRVLSKGGVLAFINVPAKFSIQTFFQKHDHYHRERLTPEDYLKACQKAGFSKVGYFYINPFPLLETKHEYFWTQVYKAVYWIRSWFMKYPMKSNKWISQAHFLFAIK